MIARVEYATDAGAFLVTAAVIMGLSSFASAWPHAGTRVVAPPVEVALNLLEAVPEPVAVVPPVAVPPAAIAPPVPDVAPPVLHKLPILPRVRPHMAPHMAKAAPVLPADNVAPAPARAVVGAAAAAAPAAVSPASAEAAYQAMLRAIIERNKSNPATPAYRMMHPTGTVSVRFSLQRSGAVGAISLAQSSGSDMLDKQAALIIAASHFPAMPADIFASETAHDFVVDITFPPFGVRE